MRQQIANLLDAPSKILNDPHNQRILVISSFVVFFSCLLFLLFGRSTGRSDIISAESNTSTPISSTPVITPTKWWIKVTQNSSLNSAGTVMPTESVGISTGSCPSNFSSPLRPGIYAYISLIPPLPNRIRSGAGKANAYLGQIQPGNGIKILDGPLCADGFYWWLVESTKTQLRGWTVMGSGSQQWIIPCPNPKTACEKIPVIPQITPTVTSLSTVENIDNRCNSNKFAIGVFAQVAEDNLLVIRSEPYIGSVIGHVGPMSAVKIIDGPACVDSALWWKVNLATPNLTGWTTEANLRVCTKENNCS